MVEWEREGAVKRITLHMGHEPRWVSPHRSRLVGTPAIPTFREFGDACRLFRREVCLLADVVVEIVELPVARFSTGGFTQKFPLADANGATGTGAPEERAVRGWLRVRSEERNQVNAVRRRIGMDAGGSEGGGRGIHGDNGRFDHAGGRNSGRPANDHRHTHTTLEKRTLLAAEWGVARGQFTGRAAVVGKKNDKGVALEAGFVEAGKDRADAVIELGEQGGEDTAVDVGDTAR